MPNNAQVSIETAHVKLGGQYFGCDNDKAPVVIIHPGSGPTDLNGNNPAGLNANTYQHLADQLGEVGVSSLRIDKRGMYSSARSDVDSNNVTLDDYSEDLAQWVIFLNKQNPDAPVFVLGHSEGGLVAINYAKHSPIIAGVILVATPGRTLDTVVKEQITNQPFGHLFSNQIDYVFDFFRQWQPIDTSNLHSSLQTLFAPSVQNFWMSLANFKPTDEIAKITLPCLIAQGDADIQVTEEDAHLLYGAVANGTLAILPNVNHVLKVVANPLDLTSYGDPAIAVSAALIDAIESFIKAT